jgi:hypothetical protein
MPTYADACSRMLTYAVYAQALAASMRAFASAPAAAVAAPPADAKAGAEMQECSRMLTYADVCRRMPTYADVC